MATTVVLAVCLDPLFPGIHEADWNSAGYIFLTANSIKEAIDHFKTGDFDVVLLGQSIPEVDGERLTFLIRATGSRVPVVSMTNSSGRQLSFADATFEQDSKELLPSMAELLRPRRECDCATHTARRIGPIYKGSQPTR